MSRITIQYLSTLTARLRTRRADLHIGVILTFVAGALNAGGFVAIGQYTSHITGIVSAFANQLVMHHFVLAGIAAVSWIAFVSGATCTALMVNYLRRRRGVHNVYAIPLLVEAMLVLLFGTFGGALKHHELADVSLAVITLCFTMGLQNALITKISRAEVRTTHLTGLTTDMGIEIGKMLYWNRYQPEEEGPVRADLQKLRIHAILIGSFLMGGIAGALCFNSAGFIFTVPLACALATIAIAPAFEH